MAASPSSEKISKFLSYVLRHKPEEIGITLDGAGWTDVEALIEKSAAHGTVFDRIVLGEVVASCEKKRFTFSEDLSRIRAAQGHSVKVDLGLEPNHEPPPLWHGTALRFLESIMQTGIRPGQRQMVHLSDNPQTALEVGRRHGKAIMIALDVEKMLDAGHDFFKADNGVWLCHHIDPRFFKLMMVAKGSDQNELNEITDRFKQDRPQPDFSIMHGDENA